MSSITIAEAVEQLREDLLQAIAQGDGRKVQFGLEAVELELGLTATREAEAGAKVKWLVVEVGGKGKAVSEDTHKLTLKLIPVAKAESGKFRRLLITDAMEKEPD
jgi:hypothetical protein